MQNLQVRLGDDNTGAAGAFAKLGINADAFNKLSTYQQMTTLGEAIKAIHDPTEQASISAALFGKTWKEILPAIKSGMEDVGNQAPVMADATVKALDRAGDAMKAAKQQAIVWGAGVVSAIESVGYGFGQFLSIFNTEHFGKTNDEMLALAGRINDPSGLKGALVSVKQPVLDVGAGVKALGSSAKDTADATVTLTRHAKESIEIHKQQADAIKKAADAAERFQNSVKAFSFGTFITDTSKLTAIIPDLSSHTEEMAAKFAEARDQMNDLESTSISYNSAVLETDAGVRKMVTAFSTLPNVVAQSTKALHDAAQETAGFGETITNGLTASLAKLPQTLIRAFEGGGGLGGAVKALGVSLSNAVAEPIVKGLSNLQKAGVTAGSGVAAALGGVEGGGTGAAIAGIASGLGGAAIAATGWGTAMAGAGVAGTVALGAATLGIGAAAVGVYLLIKHFQSAEKAVNPVREAFVQAAGGLDKLNQSAHAAGITLDHLLNAKNPDDYKAAMDELSAAFEYQDQAMKTLDDTVQKYGFTISELGPAFAAQKLDEQAGALLQDYQVLTAAGVDHVAIINKMGPALQDYVKQAQLSGAAIPESMKPALQAMVDMGTLTDDSGQAMTDLSKLTFSETLDKKFSSLIDTINKLTDAISRGLGTAIANIPDKTVHIGFQVDAPPDLGFSGGDQNNYAAGGGYVGGSGVQYLAGGGNVLRFMPRGSDTVPAMLTPGEGVVNQRGMKTLGKSGLSALNSGSAAAGGGADMSGVEDRLDGLRQDMMALLPKMIRDAVLLSQRRVA